MKTTQSTPSTHAPVQNKRIARAPATQHVLHLAIAGLFVTASPLSAQTVKPSTVEQDPSARYVPAVPSAAPRTASAVMLDGLYAANAKVGRIHVRVRNAGVPADGKSELVVDVKVYDFKDQPLLEPVLVTIETSGGKVQLLGAATDEFGPGTKDADRMVPGTQLKVLEGTGTFILVAPNQAQDVNLRLSAGKALASGTVPFNIDLREMIAAGLIEGSLRLSKTTSKSTLSPVRIDDGFEQEITRFSRSNQSSNGSERTVDARAALFLKGKISGDALLTMSFDSDKETRARLLRDLKPEEFYPVYGDASIKGFEARSSQKLYVRVDKNRSFLMYGDFATADGFSQAAGTGVVAGTNMRQLATYNRTLTGVKGHAEGQAGFVNAFAAYDSLKSVTDELRANGTSGPFAISNSSALENSEKVEAIVRDRNNLNTILSVTPYQRLNDYQFEPFSGRILLTRALPSVDANGNPQSLRITYEVDQGGKNFLVAGVDGQVNLGDTVAVGATYIQDKNPTAPLTIAGLNAGVKLGEYTTLIGEIAQTKAGAIPATSTAGATAAKTGKAARIELDHKGPDLQANAFVNRTEANFANPSTGSGAVRTQQAGVKAAYKLNPTLSVDGEVIYTDDLASDARRLGAKVGLSAQVTERIKVSLGVRHSEETGTVGSPITNIGCNPAPGSHSNGGGFTGDTLLNVNTAGINCPADSAPSTLTPASKATANTVILGVEAKVTDKLTASAALEMGKTQHTGPSSGTAASGDNAKRVELQLSYQLAEQTRAYVKADTQRGLSSQYALDTAAKSSNLSVGIESGYMAGGNVFSEYRLRDAIGGAESQIASGVRNIWNVSEGVLLSTGLERLKVLSTPAGSTAQNATALALGLDYTRSEIWKAGAKVEWRRLNGGASIAEQDTLLVNLNAARKLNRDWTLLARNYYLGTNNHGAVNSTTGLAVKNGWQDRFQLGFAYRPVDSNRFDALAKLEYKAENNISGLEEHRKVLVGALHLNYHPSRPWWYSARAAVKSVNETFAEKPGSNDTYKAYLIGGRVIYDITEKVDLGLNLSIMSGKASGQNGSSVQKGLGLEVGYSLTSNLWASLGYNVAGYTDKDLTSDYTAKGAYFRLRYKFDQDLFQGGNPDVNNTLERSAK